MNNDTELVTLHIAEDERFPDYVFRDKASPWTESIQVPANTAARWKRVHAEHDAVADEIKAAIQSQRREAVK